MASLLAPPFPLFTSSLPPSLVMQSTKVLYEYYTIILLIVIFTAVSSISTSNVLKKILFVVGFCVGVILNPVIFIFMITWAPLLFSFFIILAVLVSLLSSVLMPRHHQASQDSQPYDIEAAPPGPAVVVAIQDPQPLPPPPADPAYDTLSYKIDEESEHCSGDGCAVCLEAFEEQDECGRLIKCRHVYHRKCIDMWLAIPQHKLCPICRHNVYN